MALPRTRFLALLGLAVLTMVPLALAAGEPDSAPPAEERTPSPRAEAIREVTRTERAALDALQSRFEAAVEPRVALAIQKEIARTKQQTEIAVLRIQARFARESGLVDAATRIEASAEALQTRLDQKLPRVQPSQGDQ